MVLLEVEEGIDDRRRGSLPDFRTHQLKVPALVQRKLEGNNRVTPHDQRESRNAPRERSPSASSILPPPYTHTVSPPRSAQPFPVQSIFNYKRYVKLRELLFGTTLVFLQIDRAGHFVQIAALRLLSAGMHNCPQCEQKPGS